jgi:hypothetical protein
MLGKKKCWVLTDSRTGNSNQSIALANLLKLNYEIKHLKYNILAKLPSWFGFNILKNKKELLSSPLPDIVISAGRRCSGVALALKKKKPQIKIIQIMQPGKSFAEFDVVILPKHDKKPAKKYLFKTIFTHGALSFYPKEKQSQDRLQWQDKFSHLPSPKIGVLIGGVSRSCSFKLSHTKELITKLIAVAHNKSASLMVVTSRRTPHFASKFLKQALKENHIPHFFYDINSASENPFRGVLLTSDILIVTGDSISMCCEAAEMNKPLYIFCGEKQLGSKHRKFVESLFADKIAHPLEEKLKSITRNKQHANDLLIKQIQNLINS